MDEDEEEQVIPGLDPGLARLIDESDDKESIRFEDLHPGQVVTVRTERTIFQLSVADRKRREVVMAAMGDFQLEPTEGYFIGSSWGSPMVKPGLLVIGMRMVLTICGRQLVTPEVLSISIKSDPHAAQELVGIAQFRSGLEVRTLSQIGCAVWEWIKRFWRGK